MAGKGASADRGLISLGESVLTLDDVVRVARQQERVAERLAPETLARVEQSAAWIQSVLDLMRERELNASGEPQDVPAYYGINTGFGAQAGKTALATTYATRALSRNLVASHSAGVGEYFDEETVRATMLLRAHSLARGVSGVSPAMIHLLIEALNQQIYPGVPRQGSLGASGDLAPLSHLALALSKAPVAPSASADWHCDPRTGEAFVPLTGKVAQDAGSLMEPAYHITTNRLTGKQKLWKRVSGEEALRAKGMEPIELGAKEGLGFNNGATFSAAVAALTLYDARMLFAHAELALALSMEGLRGFRDPFLPRIHAVRGHPGAGRTAALVLRYTRGSQLLDGDADRVPVRIPPQDPYSLRCAPQVLGAISETLEFVTGTIEREINAATDNPFIFMEMEGQGRVREGHGGTEPEYLAFSGGNFHGEPIAFAMDYLGIAITELGNLAERRIFKMTDYAPHTAATGVGLNAFLIKEEEGHEVSSGYMIPQYTAASLVSECKTLAHPDSVDTIPSSANREDHVSMSLTAARHARTIVDNIEAVIAIELMCAAQAIDLQALKQGVAPGEAASAGLLGAGTRVAYELIRRHVAYLERDRVLYPDIRRLMQLIRTGELVEAAQGALRAAK